MPASNPILYGKHVTSYSNSPGSSEGAPHEAPARSVGAMIGGRDYRLPTAIVIFIALAIALLLRVWGFSLGVSARVSAP